MDLYIHPYSSIGNIEVCPNVNRHLSIFMHVGYLYRLIRFAPPVWLSLIKWQTILHAKKMLSDDGATISINGGTAATAPTLDITLSAALGTPEEAISIRVMQNGAAETYSLIIIRERDPAIRLRIKVFLEGPLQ